MPIIDTSEEKTEMGSLRITNVLLTVIAICVLYICIKEEAKPASAQSGPVLVRIDWSDLQSKSRYSPLGVAIRDQVRLDMSNVSSQSRYSPITVRVSK